MELRYTTGLDDHMAYYAFALSSIPRVQRQVRTQRIVIVTGLALAGVGVALALMWVLSGGEDIYVGITAPTGPFYIFVSDMLFPVLTGVLSGIIINVQFPKIHWRSYRGRAEAQYVDDDGAVLEREEWLEITPETLNAREARAAQQIRWSAIDEVFMTPNYTFIVYFNTMLFIVPREKVVAGDFDAFQHALRKNILD